MRIKTTEEIHEEGTMTKKKFEHKDTEVILALNKLRKTLGSLLQPEVLEKLVSLQEELGADNNGCLIERYEWFVHNGKFGEMCPYAKMAKHLFLEENGDNVIELMNWINENWISKLDNKGETND